MVIPATTEQLWSFIIQHFGVTLPWRPTIPGHSTPMKFVADAFFHPGQDVAAWANRRGGKTLAASILAALEYYFQDGPIRGRVLSGSEEQARTLYQYWVRWCDGLLRPRLIGRPQKLGTRLRNGDFEILASSPHAVRGPGIQRLYWDEVDEIDQEIMDASIGTLNSLGGVPSRTVATSTWHHAHGPMGRLMNDADKRGFHTHKWNIWDVIQPCPLEQHLHGRGCKSCPLEDACLGKAIQIDATAKIGIASRVRYGLFPIEDTIRQYRNWSLDQWRAEAECERPVLTGLVYPQFNPMRHVNSALDFQDDLPIYRAIDWGLNDFVCLWMQVSKNKHVYVVDEYCARQAAIPKVAKDIRDRHVDRYVVETYCDPAGRNRNDQSGLSDVDSFKAYGIHCDYNRTPWAREIVNGVNLIRTALAPAYGVPRLTISGNCKTLIKAIESYRLREVNGLYIDDPIKPQEWDHPMDALRYFFLNFQKPKDEIRRMGWTG